MARPGKGMECVNAVRGGGCVCKSRAACGGPSPGRTRANWPRECAGADTRWARAHHVRVCLEATMCWEQNADGSTVPECAGIVRFSNSEPCWGGGGGDQGHASPKPPSRHQQLGTLPSPSPSTGASVALADMGDLSLALSLSLSLAANRTGRRDRPQLEANDQTWIGGKSNGVDRQKSGDDVPGQADRPPQTAGLASD